MRSYQYFLLPAALAAVGSSVACLQLRDNLGRANVWGIAVHEEDVGIGRAKNKEQARVRSHVNDACDRAKPAGGRGRFCGRTVRFW
mmetsp:Transcript_2298/g.4750  ORF Transcript_2298/g.4750 Transcript_2298/m.4750 type:complete len:86 (+) Transcript_2298:587-844(+)